MTMHRVVVPSLYLTGRAGAGKDTQARYLCTRFGYTRVALADAVKDIASAISGVSVQDIENNKKHFRRLLIAIGQGARDRRMAWLSCRWIPRNIRAAYFRKWIGRYMDAPVSNIDIFDQIAPGWGHPDYWIHRWRLKAQEVASPIVVTDCRMPNEVEFFRSLGFKGIRLLVDDEEAMDRLYKRDGTTDFSFFKSETERFANALLVDWIVDGTMTPIKVHLYIADFITGRFHKAFFSESI